MRISSLNPIARAVLLIQLEIEIWAMRATTLTGPPIQTSSCGRQPPRGVLKEARNSQGATAHIVNTPTLEGFKIRNY
jgi:hypothetical protein